MRKSKVRASKLGLQEQDPKPKETAREVICEPRETGAYATEGSASNDPEGIRAVHSKSCRPRQAEALNNLPANGRKFQCT